MSYFSHNPEAYDEIMVKGVTDKLLLNAAEDATEEQREFLESIVLNLYAANVKHIKGNSNQFDVWDALTAWAHDEVMSQEQRYWDGMVP